MRATQINSSADSGNENLQSVAEMAWHIKILYSNVEEIQNGYDLFQLIAGVEQFANFGSVKALMGNEPLKKLLDATENFEVAI